MKKQYIKANKYGKLFIENKDFWNIKEVLEIIKNHSIMSKYFKKKYINIFLYYCNLLFL